MKKVAVEGSWQVAEGLGWSLVSGKRGRLGGGGWGVGVAGRWQKWLAGGWRKGLGDASSGWPVDRSGWLTGSAIVVGGRR